MMKFSTKEGGGAGPQTATGKEQAAPMFDVAGVAPGNQDGTEVNGQEPVVPSCDSEPEVQKDK